MRIRPVAAARAESITQLLAGTPYALVGSLGAGGMGEVFVVEHGFLGRRFALKLIHAHLLEERGFLERFQLEARTLARLQHPHIVEVTDFWVVSNKIPCLVMELLEGDTLAKELRRKRRLPMDDALRIASQALQALAAAHGAGIVHRDIKPDNLFLDRSTALDPNKPLVKLLDFGLVRVVVETATDLPVIHTTTGSLVGSPRYMSPEACRGERLDPRADIYSLGAVLYEMLVGDAPFDANPQSFEPPSQRLTLPVPDALDAALARALHPDPASRYASAEEFLLALRGVPSTY